MFRQSKSTFKSSPFRRQTAKKKGLLSGGKRHRSGKDQRQSDFIPPEDWYEPADESDEYVIIEQSPGTGYRHVVTPAEVRDRLAELPGELLGPLQTVQLSRMTKKKRTFLCYGMQWGQAIYLYPIEDSLVEVYSRPPTPKELTDTRMFGGRWKQSRDGWRLIWTEATIRDFYLNNVLIHELGHLLDERNGGYTDRERYAEWFAIEHGYRPTRHNRRRKKAVRRRHHR